MGEGGVMGGQGLHPLPLAADLRMPQHAGYSRRQCSTGLRTDGMPLHRLLLAASGVR